MESFLNRYRNITVLLLVIFAQLLLLALQVKNDQDVRVIRVWAVSAVTPVARLIEGLRGGGSGFLHNYILLHDTNDQNRKLQAEVDRLKMENIFLKNEVNTGDRAKALLVFQSHTPSKTVAATIIATGAGSNSKVVFVDRGTESSVQRGMAVVTPDGIVGKVIAAYPFSSQVQLITDADFAAGVISQKTQVRGTLKGQGTPMCKVDYVAFEEKIETGDWFYTSGDDRIFPRGFPVGVVKVVRPGQGFKEIYVEPSGLQRGLEDVLIVIQGVHQDLPEGPPSSQPVYIAAPPPATAAGQQPPADTPPPPSAGTEADRLRLQYKAIGDTQKHTFGAGAPGSKPPDFNLKLPNGAGLVAPPLPGAGNAGAPQQPARTPANTQSGNTPGPPGDAQGRPPINPAGAATAIPAPPPAAAPAGNAVSPAKKSGSAPSPPSDTQGRPPINPAGGTTASPAPPPTATPTGNAVSPAKKSGNAPSPPSDTPAQQPTTPSRSPAGPQLPSRPSPTPSVNPATPPSNPPQPPAKAPGTPPPGGAQKQGNSSQQAQPPGTLLPGTRVQKQDDPPAQTPAKPPAAAPSKDGGGGRASVRTGPTGGEANQPSGGVERANQASGPGPGGASH